MGFKQIASAFVLAVCFLSLIYYYQEKLLYMNEIITPKQTSANPSPYQNPGQVDLEYVDLYLTTPDNIKVHCWWIPQQNSKTSPTILFFHENAGNMGFRLPGIRKMFHDLGANIFMLSYRGLDFFFFLNKKSSRLFALEENFFFFNWSKKKRYGNSEGEPSEEGLKLDAATSLEYVHNNWDTLDIDRQKIYLFGRSLGGAVAVHLASQNNDKLAGVILENTFTSIADMVKKVLPFLDFDFVKRYVLRMHWKSIQSISHITCPLLFLTSERDEIVPNEQMHKLYHTANSTRFKSWYTISKATHNDAWVVGGDQYWNEIRVFLQNTQKLADENGIKQTNKQIQNFSYSGQSSFDAFLKLLLFSCAFYLQLAQTQIFIILTNWSNKTFRYTLYIIFISFESVHKKDPPHGREKTTQRENKKKHYEMKDSTASTLCIVTLIFLSVIFLLGFVFLAIFRRYSPSKWYQKRFDRLTVLNGHLMQIFLGWMALKIILYGFPSSFNDDNEMDKKWWYKTLEFFIFVCIQFQ
ncbi:hypothetical protein RFI_08101 [Reticulomyxa filosa]|uniref:Serine aminopeptidase S33 domain-containing protein n=1 Tax=Reticulomyxa filosa TaxID=46433 RepID=X6NRW6_RETFI|nr:hypothetical protein RFI_08101 [Reticulomyxa filosa]|eukprot:ETO29025.1 hypothetical protein RFI_08101 [Reticulomyxa filosa]